MKKIGIYVHIPFCKKKCYYCDFLSFSGQDEIQEKYVEALISEIKFFFENRQDLQPKTIYIGGGTPSYISEKNIKRILEELKPEVASEVTIEVNPGTVNKEKLSIYKESSVNRLSIGLQSTDNTILKQIGRIHTYETFLTTYNLAREVGFKNINIDLIIGLPNQKIMDIKNSIEKVIKLNPEHISIYSLIVEENTIFSKMIEEGQVVLPDEELERNMYWYAKNLLELNKYKHYEISNFAKKGFESEHNLDCWEQNEYIGFGLGAHSYINGVRFSNISDLEQYIKNCEEKEFKKNRIIQEQQDEYLMMQEYMLLGLRKIDGVSIQSFKNKFDQNPIFVFRHELNKLVKLKLIVVNENTIKLTNKGLDLANIVWEEFV